MAGIFSQPGQGAYTRWPSTAPHRKRPQGHRYPSLAELDRISIGSEPNDLAASLLSLLMPAVTWRTEASQVGGIEEQGMVTLMRCAMVNRVGGRHDPKLLAHPAQRLSCQLSQAQLLPESCPIKRVIALGFGAALCHTAIPRAFIAASARLTPVDRPDSDALVDLP